MFLKDLYPLKIITVFYVEASCQNKKNHLFSYQYLTRKVQTQNMRKI